MIKNKYFILGLIFLISISSVNALSLTDNLLSYWNFNNNLNDSLNVYNFSTISGLTYDTGIINNSGTIKVATTQISQSAYKYTNNNNELTISFWIKNATLPSTSKTIIDYQRDTNGWILSTENGCGTTKYNFKSGGMTFCLPANLSNNSVNWTHIVWVSNATDDYFYKNGVIFQTNLSHTAKSNLDTTSAILSIFSLSNSNSQGFNGAYLDEMGIWNRMLSSTEVTQLYNNSNGLTYPFTISGTPVITTTGNITTDGLYTVVSFYANGSFNVTGTINNASILLIGGGGGGAGAYNIGYGSDGAGGGAGGLIYNNANYTITTGNYNVIIGNGGVGGTASSTDSRGTNGENTTFNSLIAIGGGRGGWLNLSGGNGGSGGGSGLNPTTNIGNGTINQGYNGGLANAASGNYPSGGGGGAGSLGGNATTTVSGAGGLGRNITILNGSNICYAGGGSGGLYASGGTSGSVSCGGGIGGKDDGTRAGTAGTANTGGGGGGAGTNSVSANGGAGGSGIVIIRFISGITTYSIKGDVTYNSTAIYNATILLINPTTNTIYANTTTNATGQYIFNSTTYSQIINNSVWVISAFFRNVSTYYAKNIWVNVTTTD